MLGSGGFKAYRRLVKCFQLLHVQTGHAVFLLFAPQQTSTLIVRRMMGKRKQTNHYRSTLHMYRECNQRCWNIPSIISVKSTAIAINQCKKVVLFLNFKSANRKYFLLLNNAHPVGIFYLFMDISGLPRRKESHVIIFLIKAHTRLHAHKTSL